MHLSILNQKARTANRNNVLLFFFAERVALKLGKSDYNTEQLQEAIKEFGTPKEIDAFFDKFTIAFGNWLLKRTPRTLEHPMEELLNEFREYQSTAPDEEQVDN